jgi:hypothetical protein
MAVFTPRGLKIRLSPKLCFTLISRLYPKIDAFKVLQTTEGMDDIISLLPFITGIICFILKLDPLYIGLYVAISAIIGNLINLFGLYIIPGLIKVSLFFSYFSGYYLNYVAIAMVGFIFSGWLGVLGFVLGRMAGGVIFHIFHIYYLKSQLKKYGVTFGVTEREFFNSYRTCASKIGVTTDLDLSEDEINDNKWEIVFEDYMEKCPGAASMCSD